MKSYQVAYYRTERGDEPVKVFVEKQDTATRSKINRFITMLEMYGPDLGMPYARYLKAGLYELRIRGRNEVRIFYISLVSEHTVLFLHAFNKRTQKLPAQELSIAKARQRELTGL